MLQLISHVHFCWYCQHNLKITCIQAPRWLQTCHQACCLLGRGSAAVRPLPVLEHLLLTRISEPSGGGVGGLGAGSDLGGGKGLKQRLPLHPISPPTTESLVLATQIYATYWAGADPSRPIEAAWAQQGERELKWSALTQMSPPASPLAPFQNGLTSYTKSKQILLRPWSPIQSLFCCGLSYRMH